MVDLSEFTHSLYPDGHRHVVSDKDLHGDTTISAAIRTFDDLFMIAQIKKIHPELTHLAIKYLLAARCDRRFSPGESCDLEIVCDYINRLGFESISVYKPHNEELTKKLLGYDNVWITDPTYSLLEAFHKNIPKEWYSVGSINGSCIKNVYVVSPDAGASGWIQNVTRNNYHYLWCSKNRVGDKIVVNVPVMKHDIQNYLIVDDLCDGGGTFIEISKAIKLQMPDAKVYLAVTHAIFSKGLAVFDGHIERIYCTDTFAEWEHPLVRQIEV